jgi:hypothetical protein
MSSVAKKGLWPFSEQVVHFTGLLVQFSIWLVKILFATMHLLKYKKYWNQNSVKEYCQSDSDIIQGATRRFSK